MPFTFSHPAAVLPLKKLSNGKLSLAGLIAGSIVPDFEYFIFMKSNYSHSLRGIFTFNMPVALIILLIFFCLIRRDMLDNLPSFLHRRLAPTLEFDWLAYFRKNWLWVLISILLGTFTHILWDSTTHRTGYFVVHSAFLSGQAAGFPVYRILQYISTIFGAVIIAAYIYRLPCEKENKQKINPLYWLSFTALTLVLWHIIYKNWEVSVLWYTVVSFISATLWALVINSIFFRVKAKIL